MDNSTLRAGALLPFARRQSQHDQEALEQLHPMERYGSQRERVNLDHVVIQHLEAAPDQSVQNLHTVTRQSAEQARRSSRRWNWHSAVSLSVTGTTFLACLGAVIPAGPYMTTAIVPLAVPLFALISLPATVFSMVKTHADDSKRTEQGVLSQLGCLEQQATEARQATARLDGLAETWKQVHSTSESA